jgi:predicted DNA-binding transcriptional regulator AlpA
MSEKLNPAAFSNMNKVCTLLGVGETTIYTMINSCRFPRPVKITKNIKAFRNSDIIEYLNGNRTWPNKIEYIEKEKEDLFRDLEDSGFGFLDEEN